MFILKFVCRAGSRENNWSAIICKRCNMLYIRETKNKLSVRFSAHLRTRNVKISRCQSPTISTPTDTLWMTSQSQSSCLLREYGPPTPQVQAKNDPPTRNSVSKWDKLYVQCFQMTFSNLVHVFFWHFTFVSKALRYRTFKKLDCSLIWNFYRMYHSIHF